MNRNQFYLRYYGGSRGKFGHEFIEFVIKPNGHFMYINNSHYKNDTVIKRKGYLSATAIQAFKDMVKDSNILTEDDSKWPEPDYKGKQELEICMDGQHVSFTCCKLFSVSDCENSRLLLKDPDGLRALYYLAQDLKCLVFAIMSVHFKIKPI
ncbi:Protein mago nashi -like protein [Trichinella pseudospiralis]|uniref:Protein mago nashi-like protein n=2 Tax=Trichinella pseudospiralis TaxID=6337 RepID=A0A0V1G453_TRIPS|nr:Protein mago nashi -like protein [Trichinella pseudospiralis]KRY93049.1 Protein mago nashi -like protein [Trichinella pseudospiralis]KRZ26634.1 Protein mago nashi -like protein [Trichinella pseudospiralis]KRZ41430.1 Protein mago nashi -like protein [Trichinella pseudospiralis]